MPHILDLHFQGEPEVIASYVLRGPAGVALIETGPGSTLPHLQQGLAALGIELGEITDILLTHIHLDHAGAAGWLAQATGAAVHVHHVGARHMIDPSRLLSSARRIYGDLMDALWGDFLPVPAAQVHELHDGDVIAAAGAQLVAIDTPGHAYHHMAYLWDGLCFTGDVAGVRLPGFDHIRLPTPPPEIDLPAWHASLSRLAAHRPDQLMLTHFGAAPGDPQLFLARVGQQLESAAAFVRQRWQAGLSEAEILPEFTNWVAAQAAGDGCDPGAVHRYEVVVPSYMEVTGLARYFRKVAAEAGG